MATDKQEENRLWWIVRGIVALIIVLFLLAAFGVIAETCDSNKVTLNCRIKPTFFDVIGVIGFVAAAYFMVTGGRPFVKRDLFNEPGSGKWAGYTFGVLVVSFFFFWFL